MNTTDNGTDKPEDEPRSAAPQSLFRAAALQAHEDDYSQGVPLLVVSLWTRVSVALLVTAAALGIGYVSVVPVSTYARGSARVVEDAGAEGHGRPIIELEFPGQVRPRLTRDTPMFVELEGFPASRTPVEVEAISALLEAEDASASGPILRVRGRLPQAEFEAAEGRFVVYAGMRARAEAELGSKPLLSLLVPQLYGG